MRIFQQAPGGDLGGQGVVMIAAELDRSILATLHALRGGPQDPWRNTDPGTIRSSPLDNLQKVHKVPTKFDKFRQHFLFKCGIITS